MTAGFGIGCRREEKAPLPISLRDVDQELNIIITGQEQFTQYECATAFQVEADCEWAFSRL